MKNTSRTVGLAIMAIGLAAAIPVFAQSATETAPQADAPAMKPNDMGQMMEGGGMMNMMTQMNEMMSACTKMMQAMTPKTPNEGETPSNPG